MPQNITNRQIEILYELLNTENDDKYITNNQLSEELGVSKRTIRRELKILEQYFEDRDDIQLIKKRGQGNKLVVSQKLKLQLIENYQIHYNKGINLDPEKRILKIISFLLNNTKQNKSYLLEKKLNISTSTLNRDLKEVEKYLDNFNLQIKTFANSSKEIVGSEFNLRLLTVDVLLELISKKKQYQLLSQLKEKKFYKNKELSILKDFIFSNKLEQIYAKAAVFQKSCDIYFTTGSLIFIIVYLALSSRRSSINKNIENIENLFILNNEFDYPKSFEYFCSELSGLYPKLQSKKEKKVFFILFFALTNLNSKKEDNYSSFLNKNIKEKIKITSEQIANNYREKLSKNIDYNYDSLYVHLKNFFINIILIYNFRLNIEILTMEKHELKKIIENNPYTFYIAESFKELINKNLNLKIKEIDLQYLGILFLKFMESQIQDMTAVVIQDNSFAVNELSKTRLENSFPYIDFKFKNYFSIEKSKLKDYDLLISTKYFSEFENLIVVSPIINTADRKKIEEKIKVVNDLKRFIN